jgi:putative colanic acid biosynthesis glycosyltransferase WcaI
MTANYPPEIGPNARITADVAENLTTRGQQVCVLTGLPNHPTGVIPEAYRGLWYLKTVDQGIEIVRTLTLASPRRTFARRLLNALSIAVSNMAVGLFGPRPDVILTVSPPFPYLLAPLTVGLLRRRPVVVLIQDLYPATAIHLGVLRSPVLIWLARRFERWVYRRAARVVVISEGFRGHVLNSGADPSKVAVLPNWVDAGRFGDGQAHEFRTRLGLDGKFAVMFAGTVGMAQGLEVVLSAAERLQHRREIAFVVVGDGAERARLAGRAKTLGLGNVAFYPPVPKESMPDLLAAADCCIVHLRSGPPFNVTIPCKVYEIMAAGRPMIVGVEGEAARLVESKRVGITIPPDDPDALARAIVALADDPRLVREFSAAGRRAAMAAYDRPNVIAKLHGLLLEATSAAS